MVIAFFIVKNKEERFWVFEKTFLLGNFSINIVLRKLFLTLKNNKVNFVNKNI